MPEGCLFTSLSRELLLLQSVCTNSKISGQVLLGNSCLPNIPINCAMEFFTSFSCSLTKACKIPCLILKQ